MCTRGLRDGVGGGRKDKHSTSFVEIAQAIGTQEKERLDTHFCFKPGSRAGPPITCPARCRPMTPLRAPRLPADFDRRPPRSVPRVSWAAAAVAAVAAAVAACTPHLPLRVSCHNSCVSVLGTLCPHTPGLFLRCVHCVLTSVSRATERHFKQAAPSAPEPQADPTARRTRDLVSQPRKPPAEHILSIDEDKNVARRDEATPVRWTVVHQSFNIHVDSPRCGFQSLPEFDPHPADLRGAVICDRSGARAWAWKLVREAQIHARQRPWRRRPERRLRANHDGGTWSQAQCSQHAGRAEAPASQHRDRS